ncbi:DUF4785 domain-containing protein [Shewanella sp. JM162201]|uniref:DUF4785 domain-containing protein n=1 Tax=Shewanella jiangmenensis TaxID=2837387 RepID=A0ABS5V1G5_9GAMM|nr:DUF4785 family protein [Shewanella jiangmenensis]MBT1444309.1 DUF4785 domain-containing protein [Shewanella jiangmenensis]
MNTHNKLAAALLMTLLLGACQDDNQTTLAESFSTARLNSPIGADFSPQTLSSPSGTGLNASRDAVEFISPLSGAYQASSPSSQQLLSDEYWFSVSGADLNRGVGLNLTQGGAVIRIAPRADMSSGALYHAEPIAPETLQLQAPKGAQIPNLVRSMADSQALASAGMNDDSSALLLSPAAPAGEYRLKSRTTLDSRGQYLVNVKEKGSPYKLHLSNPMSAELGSEALALNLSLDGVDSTLHTRARIRHAGEEYPVAISGDDGQRQLEVPQTLGREISAELSEILIDVEASGADVTVKRTIKSAVRLYSPSGRIQQDVVVKRQQGTPVAVIFQLELAGAGRFEASAVVTGIDASGNEVAIHRTQAAAWLDGSGTLALPLSRELIEQSGLKPPFQLRELKLADQGQMATLSYQDRALTL